MDWHRRFRIVTKQMGNVSQASKADLLYVMSGEEIQRIINTMSYLPENPQEGYESAYDDLVASLETYFKKLCDPTVNLTVFNNMKQGAKEDAREFQLRVMRQAALCGLEGNTPMLKERYAKGLHNQEVAELAFIQGWSMEQTAEAASRKEAWQSTHKESPLLETQEMPKVVAAIGRQQSQAGDNRWSGRQNASEERPYKQHRQQVGSGPSRMGETKAPPCKNCGIREHRYGKCPAIGQKCLTCGKEGHFRRVCRSGAGKGNQVRELKEEGEREEEVKMLE